MTLTQIYPDFGKKGEKDSLSTFFSSLLIRTNFQAVPRHRLGWRGLSFCGKNGEAWTCKIKGRKGVFGIWCDEESESGDGICSAAFKVCYFPSPDEDLLDNFSLECAVMVGDKEYNNYTRSFLLYKEFYSRFILGELVLSVDSELNNISLAVRAEEQIKTYLPEGLCLKREDSEEEWLIKPGGLDQDLGAYDLIFSFYKILASTLTYNLGEVPSVLEEVRWTTEFRKSFRSLNLVYGDEYSEELSEFFINSCLIPCKYKSWKEGDAAERPYPDAEWWIKDLCLFNKNSFHAVDNSFLPELIILTGFLGSGKTSFLQRFIEYYTRNNRFVAVIQNEIGETGLDSKLLEDNYAVKEMDEGCICCSLLGNLRSGIADISKNYNPDIIVLETTGLANPKNFLSEIQSLDDCISGSKVLTVIDASNYMETMQETIIVRDQVETADAILINKTDITGRSMLDRIILSLKEINNRAIIHSCIRGDINPARIFENINTVKKTGVNKAHKHVHNHTDEGFVSEKIRLERPLNKEIFISQIDGLANPAYRIKGILSFEGLRGRYVFQYVNGKYELSDFSSPDTQEDYLVFIGNKKTLNELQHFNFYNY